MPRISSARFIIHLFLFAGLLHVAPSWGGEPLTLLKAQRLAVERSRLLNAQDASISAAHAMAAASSQLPDPVLKLGVDNLPINGDDRFSLSRDFMTMRRIGIMQEMTRADKRHLKSARFEREAEKSRAEKNAAIATIERDTALAWLGRYYAEAMLSVVAEQIQQAKLEIEAAQSAYRSGRGSQADVFTAKSALAMLEDKGSEINLRARNAKTILARWTGDVDESSLAGLPNVDSISLHPQTLETHLQNHPEITALTKQEEIAKTEAQLAQANKKADWSWEVAFQQRGSAYSNMVSLGVSIPLQWDQEHRQDRELAAKQALVEEAHAKRDEMLRDHIAEVRTMIAEWESNRERRTRYQDELLPFAKNRTQAVLAAYRGGKSTLTDVLASRRNEIEIRLQALQLDLEIAKLWAQISFLTPSTTSAISIPEEEK